MSDAPVAYFDDDGRAIFRCSAATRCTKELVGNLLGYTPVPPPADMQARFDDGHRLEPVLLDRVRSQGWELYGGQDEYEIAVGPDIIIRGHVDSLGTHPVHGLGLVEAKTMAPKPFEEWRRLGFAASDLTRHYAQQVSLYWEAIKPDVLVFVVGKKGKGADGETVIDEFSYRMFYEPPAQIGPVKAHVVKAARLARNNILPDTCDKKSYPCSLPFLHDDKPSVVEEMMETAQVDAMTLAAKMYLDAKRARDKEAEVMAVARLELIGLMGQRERAALDGFQVVKSVQRRKSLDKAKLAEAGIDLANYEVETETEVLTVKAVGE